MVVRSIVWTYWAWCRRNGCHEQSCHYSIGRLSPTLVGEMISRFWECRRAATKILVNSAPNSSLHHGILKKRCWLGLAPLYGHDKNSLPAGCRGKVVVNMFGPVNRLGDWAWDHKTGGRKPGLGLYRGDRPATTPKTFCLFYTLNGWNGEISLVGRKLQTEFAH